MTILEAETIIIKTNLKNSLSRISKQFTIFKSTNQNYRISTPEHQHHIN